LTADAGDIVTQAFKLLRRSYRPIAIKGHSNVLIGAGVGSSATLCVGILRAIQALAGETSSVDHLAALANKLEERFHGNPSGLDAAVVASEKVIGFRRGESPQEIQVSNVRLPAGESAPWRFAIIDSRERSSTKAMVEKASPFFLGEKRGKILEKFEQFSSLTIKGLESGVAADVAEAMNGCNDLLTSAGVMTPGLAKLVADAMKLGCLGAKMTGAGGGGCVLALLDPAAWTDQLVALRNKYSDNHVFEAFL
jgi:mevalonate kinase